MKCPKCEADVLKDALFCQRCGENLRSEAAGEAKDDEPVGREQSTAERFKEGAKAKTNDDYDPEEDLWKGGYSGKAMYGNWLVACVATIGLIAIGIGLMVSTAGLGTIPVVGGVAILVAILWLTMFGILVYRKWSVHYELTSQRFIHKDGILKRTTNRIEVIDMDDVTYSQGIVERMLGVGKIQISSSDRSHPELTLIGIDDVQRVAGLIDDVRRKERRRRGLHIEAI